jgi:hypothetical protein
MLRPAFQHCNSVSSANLFHFGDRRLGIEHPS